MAGDILFLWVASIPLGYLAGLVLHWPPFWIYAMLNDQVIKCVWCFFRLRSRKWMKKIEAPAAKPTAKSAAEAGDILLPGFPALIMRKKAKGGFGVKKDRETGLYAREFAALYGLSRGDAAHYDKIGLFHPALRGENGYRLYALDQIPQLDFLLLLRDAGVPLSDIRKVLQTATPQQTLALLRKQEEKVRGQIKTLRRLEKRIAFTAGHMETGLKTVCERPRVEEWDTAYYLSFPAGPDVWGDRYRRIAFVRRVLKQYGETSPRGVLCAAV